MKLANFIKLAATGLTVAATLAMSTQAADVIGAVAPKTGPLGGGALVTQWPNVELWSKQVNANWRPECWRLQMIWWKLSNMMTRQTQVSISKRRSVWPEVDKVDFIVAPYGTGLIWPQHLSMQKYGYPHIAVSSNFR